MVVIKSLLAQLDFLFLTDHTSDKHLPSDSPRHFSKEDLGEGFSYLYFHYSRSRGVRDDTFALVDTRKAATGYYLQMLVEAAHIRLFVECELMVDAFLYQCVYDRSTRTFTIIDPKPEK